MYSFGFYHSFFPSVLQSGPFYHLAVFEFVDFSLSCDHSAFALIEAHLKLYFSPGVASLHYIASKYTKTKQNFTSDFIYVYIFIYVYNYIYWFIYV
jgi:hypothetical protein